MLRLCKHVFIRVLCAFGFIVLVIANLAHAEEVPRTKPGEITVYMVLLPNSDMAHATEMPTLQKCLDAIRYLTQARCIEVVKPLSGDWPEEILQLIPPPDDEPY